MAKVRFKAVQEAYSRENIDVKLPADKITDYFSSNVFTTETMKKYLSKDAFKKVAAAVKTAGKIDREVADQVAAAMKAWAISKGATHFTHWFQPLTGATAEKHDTFFVPTSNNEGIEQFDGDMLVQQEPDASSFPHGGLRTTFEARGYTAWDPSSPAFIMEIGTHGRTLCIPTIFVSYTGEALDYKAPLLKSQHLLEAAAVPVCRYFDRQVSSVFPTLGWEQEYFVVDEALYYARPDLVQTGRTLLGRTPAKGQQLSDHYFGTIPERVYAYMLDFETEAHKLGIPLRTRHNEVAPSQYECAPEFSEVNLSVDRNQLLMDLMERVSRKHKLKVLLHEKPYADINGSGKHNNWSMSTDQGKNLLSPGKTPRTNLQFLTFFVNTIKAVHDNADLIRAAIASASNDHRLGGHEAPPAIISIFIGEALTKVLAYIEEGVKGKLDEFEKQELKMNIHSRIPDLLLDNTDRNRTSPFAFTGNKFEIRAVGSSGNCALPMTIMNTIVATQLNHFTADVEKLRKEEKEQKESAILRILQRYITESKSILFEGDNYSASWQKEAKKRGLSNAKTTPEALDFLISDKAKKLFAESGVYNEGELMARYEVWMGDYQMKIQIEGRTLREMCLNQIIPAAIEYQNELLKNLTGLKSIGVKSATFKSQKALVAKIAGHVEKIYSLIKEMEGAADKAAKSKSTRQLAYAYCDKVRPYFAKIRAEVDEIELYVDDALWPLPKYRELLFIK